MGKLTLESLKRGQWAISRKDSLVFQIEDIVEERSLFSRRITYRIKLKGASKTRLVKSYDTFTRDFFILQSPYITKVLELERSLENSANFQRPVFPQTPTRPE